MTYNKETAVYNKLVGEVKEFNRLKGRMLSRIVVNGDEIRMYLTDENYVRFYHEQDCCEHVRIEDVCGDFNDLIGEPLTEAEEVYGYNGPSIEAESYTWTFYKFATCKGSVTVRWLGTSNGYYSEGVSVEVVGGVKEQQD